MLRDSPSLSTGVSSAEEEVQPTHSTALLWANCGTPPRSWPGGAFLLEEKSDDVNHHPNRDCFRGAV